MTTHNASAGDIPGENARAERLGSGCYAYSADGCSNTGFIVGEHGVLVIDGQPTPNLAEKALEKIREVTDKPIKLVVLTHYHADSVLGAPAFEASEIIASDLTRRMIDTRGMDELLVSQERFPAVYSAANLTKPLISPSMTIASSMSINLGNREVRLMHLGRGHTMGDLVVWVPDAGAIYAGDLVQTQSSPYCGDAHLADWPRALDRIGAFRPTSLMPGRGKSAHGASAVAAAVETTREFVTALRDSAAACVEGNMGLKDTFITVRDALAPQFSSKTDFETHLKFNVARAYDEALGSDQPQVWTRERHADLESALNGAILTSEKSVEVTPHEMVEDASQSEVQEQVVEELVLAETHTTAPQNGNTTGFLSDSDFAASLIATPEDGAVAEDDTLNLSEGAIVETDDEDVEFAASGDERQEPPKMEQKVLEQAGA